MSRDLADGGTSPTVLFLDGIRPFGIPWADPDLCMVCGRVADFSDDLLEPEKAGLERMVDVRRAEYSSGRRVARHALDGLGIADWPVVARGRLPIWPPGVVGSITHSRDIAMAIVGREQGFAGVGVDLELMERVTDRLAERVLVPSERRGLVEEDWRTMLFAAKEAAYKAVNPEVGEYLAFGDVQVSATEGGRFRAATTRPRGSTVMLEIGHGFFQRVEGHWLCVFLVPND